MCRIQKQNPPASCNRGWVMSKNNLIISNMQAAINKQIQQDSYEILSDTSYSGDNGAAELLNSTRKRLLGTDARA